MEIGQQSNKHGAREAEPGPEADGELRVSSGPWRFLRPCHTSRFLPAPAPLQPSPHSPLGCQPSRLSFGLSSPEQELTGSEPPARGSTAGERRPPARGRHDRARTERAGAGSSSGTGGMEPARTMAELISTSADGKDHGSRNGEGGEGARGGQTGPRSEARPGHRPVTAAARAGPAHSALSAAGAGPGPRERLSVTSR